jgi:plasmid stabilization system protein ParE
MSRIEIRPQAEREIADAADWYEQRSPGLGTAFIQSVGEALTKIAEQPLAFSPVGRGARRFVIHRYPFAIIYRAESGSIVAYSCFHGRRDPRRWRERP